MHDVDRYDAIVIGSGQGGTPLSSAFARAGYRTALIEQDHVGGTCINTGCTPSKTLVASARLAYLVHRAPLLGVRRGAVSVDMNRIQERKRAVVQRFRNGSRKRLEGTPGLDLITAHASFADEMLIALDSKKNGHRQLSADRICINTGSRPAIPPIEGLAGVPYLDSTSVMELDVIPRKLLILGGGYVGLEFGQMFRRFGSDVTIIQQAKRLLPREDEDVSAAITSILREDGIEILNGAETVGAERGPRGRIRLHIRVSSSETLRTGTHLLIATGRVPNTDALNPSAGGVELDERHYVKVNEHLETSASGVYALGDVKGGPGFTHISYDDFRILRSNLLHNGKRSTRGRIVPFTMYTDPQLGRVGLTETEARNQGHVVMVARMPMSHVARALEVDETRGFLKAVINRENGQILGCAVLGSQGGEIAAILQMAMMGNIPYSDLRDGIFAHPTLAEALNNLFLSVEE